MVRYSTLDDATVLVAAQQGNRHAQRALIKRYQLLIHTVADRFRSFFADPDDLRQEGSIGFCKAIRNFDPKRDAAFATFAQLCIRSQIISALRAAAALRHGALNQSLPIDEGGLYVADTACTPEMRVLRAEAVADIRRAVAAGLNDR
ncbi:MAG TPA: sigma-70 family RNA polymerase sigma factor, partial [bacterium]|nr:sigma-70 family RNA polymerase sigma factor [bacterium]